MSVPQSISEIKSDIKKVNQMANNHTYIPLMSAAILNRHEEEK